VGCAGVLMLPPFYYKNVSDEGLYRYFSDVIESVGDNRLRVYLYHIPPVSQTPITLSLIERLLKKYPRSIAGIKDSSGDWSNTEAMLKEFQPEGFDVFAGSETFLLKNMQAGGAGCITATGNVNPGPIVKLYREWQNQDALKQQQDLDSLRSVFARFPMIAAMKAAIAWKTGRDDWRVVRPPLVELSDEQSKKLEEGLSNVRFELPNALNLV
jgi:4-hydroxy-tetrahydrodipicolinate synthase